MFEGAMEFGLAAADRYVVAHTNKYVCYEFWWCVQSDPKRIATAVEYFQPIEDKNVFYLLQENWPSYSDPYVRAALFLLLNRYSATGKISSGEFNSEAYRPTDIVQLQNLGFRNLHILLDKEEDFVDSLSSIHGRCDYVFVPVGAYTLNVFENEKQGYEDTYVCHKSLKKVFEETENNMVLLYEASKAIVDLYKDYKMVFVDKYGRKVPQSELASEVLIANF
tara:strand:+ start:425 stop:1090 length:666 start_codon:yes stop_codon:yes gene_type:complete